MRLWRTENFPQCFSHILSPVFVPTHHFLYMILTPMTDFLSFFLDKIHIAPTMALSLQEQFLLLQKPFLNNSIPNWTLADLPVKGYSIFFQIRIHLESLFMSGIFWIKVYVLWLWLTFFHSGHSMKEQNKWLLHELQAWCLWRIKKFLRAEVVTQWSSTCLAYPKPWVQSPALEKKIFFFSE